jgi:hypothetical protein
MKSSEFGWESSFVVEFLATMFLGSDEFWAKAECVAANATSIRVITRNFCWFTGSFLTAKLELGARSLPAIVTTQILLHAPFHSSDIVYSSTRAGFELLPRPLVAAEPKSPEKQLA